jgi:hypothetical protein
VGRDFPHLSKPAPGPTQPPVQWVPSLSRGKDGRGEMLTTHPLLVPRLRKSLSIPPLTLWVLLGLLRGFPPLPPLLQTQQHVLYQTCAFCCSPTECLCVTFNLATTAFHSLTDLSIVFPLKNRCLLISTINVNIPRITLIMQH